MLSAAIHPIWPQIANGKEPVAAKAGDQLFIQNNKLSHERDPPSGQRATIGYR